MVPCAHLLSPRMQFFRSDLYTQLPQGPGRANTVTVTLQSGMAWTGREPIFKWKEHLTRSHDAQSPVPAPLLSLSLSLCGFCALPPVSWKRQGIMLSMPLHAPAELKNECIAGSENPKSRTGGLSGKWAHPGGQVRPLHFARQNRHYQGGCSCLRYKALLQVANKFTCLPHGRSQRSVCRLPRELDK